MAGNLRVTQRKSTISHIARNRGTVRALGLHGIGSTVVVPDNEATRGMVRQVRFLVEVEEVPAVAAPSRRRARPAAAEARVEAQPQAETEATAEEKA
jgi:large subunit ribosomal protein L30